ncbi:hypothetical protein CC86DRAFT_368208 [Ophiobolus disseminans]|uniref:Uncharacterized protein n=1 Tax=Ophiobolus disseminans TaxID=1469910 RepID=A0A6A7A792_9PLEO|nr:hypothetical protein CC86DRAFT_368208 [Ophiobolus disseminans]
MDLPVDCHHHQYLSLVLEHCIFTLVDWCFSTVITAAVSTRHLVQTESSSACTMGHSPQNPYKPLASMSWRLPTACSCSRFCSPVEALKLNVEREAANLRHLYLSPSHSLSSSRTHYHNSAELRTVRISHAVISAPSGHVLGP